jgi:glutathione S-transferase
MLQLYGNARSRAIRCLWMLEEVGEPYQLIEKSTRTDDLQSAEYVRLNPNARIPTLVDGDFVLWESMAINLYLAQKYSGPMHCADPKLLGLAAQWSFWAMLEVEALLLDLLQHRAVLPEFARDASYAERDELLLRKPLGVLNTTLAERAYLAGGQFSVADLNVASILVWGKMGRCTCQLTRTSHDGWRAVWRGPLTAECVIRPGANKRSVPPFQPIANSEARCFTMPVQQKALRF